MLTLFKIFSRTKFHPKMAFISVEVWGFFHVAHFLTFYFTMVFSFNLKLNIPFNGKA